jgi:hypothetical protein
MDPHIQAFEILSDRISNLEDTVAALAESARLNEITTYGPLNFKMLGLPCPISRHKATERVSGRLLGASANVSALIVSFPETSSDEILDLRRCYGTEWIASHFTPDDATSIRKAQEKNAGNLCVTMKEAGIPSYHRYLNGELLQRLVDEARVGVFEHEVIIRPFNRESGSAFLVLQQEKDTEEDSQERDGPMPFHSVCAGMVRLVQALSGQAAKRMETFELCAIAAHAFVRYMKWRSANDFDLARLSRTDIAVEHLRSLESHVFFSEELCDDAIEDFVIGAHMGLAW